MSNDNPAEGTTDRPFYEEHMDELLKEMENTNISLSAVLGAVLFDLTVLKVYHRTLRHEIASLRAALEEREIGEVIDEMNERLHEELQQATVAHIKRLRNLPERYERKREDD